MTPEDEEVSEYGNRLTRYLKRAAEVQGIPGIVVGIFTGKHQVLASTGTAAIDGPEITPDHRFRLGRSSRWLLAMVMRDFETRGELSIHESVGNYLPEFRSSEFGQTVKLTHLLSETSGVVMPDVAELGGLAALSWQDLVQRLKSGRFLFPAGSTFSANAVHSIILAGILERVAGRSIADIVRTFLDQSARPALDSKCTGNSTAPNVQPHILDPATGKVRACPARGPSDLLSLGCSDAHLSVREIGALLRKCVARTRSRPKGGAFSDQVLETQEQLLALPKVLKSARADEAPVAAGIGCLEYRRGWFGVEGPVTGQSLSIRFHGLKDLSVVVGANISRPAALRSIREHVMMSLCGDGTAPESHEPAIHLVGDEVIGRYEGMNGGTLAVRRGFDGGLDLVLQRSRRAFQIEFSLKQSISGAWSMEGDKHPLNVGFFRDAYSSQQCVLVGNVAYRKAVHENAID